jgi:hypothetical protein
MSDWFDAEQLSYGAPRSSEKDLKLPVAEEDELSDRLLDTAAEYKEAQSTPSQTDVTLARIALPALIRGERSPAQMSINYSTSDDPGKGIAHSAEIRVLKIQGDKVRYFHIPGGDLWEKHEISADGPGITQLDKLNVLTDLETLIPGSGIFETIQDRAFEDSDITKLLAAYLVKNAKTRSITDYYRTDDPSITQITSSRLDPLRDVPSFYENLYLSNRDIELKVKRENRRIQHVLSVKANNPVSRLSDISSLYRLTVDRTVLIKDKREWPVLNNVKAQSILSSTDGIFRSNT